VANGARRGTQMPPAARSKYLLAFGARSSNACDGMPSVSIICIISSNCKKNSQLPNVHSSNLIGSAKQRSRRVHFNEYARQRPYVDLCRVLNAQ
jgi:hypothetical protein